MKRSAVGPGRSVVLAAVCVALLLSAFSQGYDYERDELYFRMLSPAWGYVDQPPLVPLLADLTQVIADEPWALRIPSTLAVVASVFVVAAIARELGGDRRSEGLAAWAFGSSAAAMILGHVLLTTTFDLLVWPLVCLFALRALLRDEGRWWLYAGVVAGIASYDKLLVVWLLLGIGIGLLLLGPRRVLITRPLLLGCLVCFVLALPNVVYQVANGWPQLRMGAALADNNAGEVRWFMWVLLLIVIGPTLVPIWVAGLVGILRRPAWRSGRCIVVAFGVVLLLTFVSGAQPHYPTGLLVVLLAAGAVPTAERMRTSRGWTALVAAAVAVNFVASVFLGLPVLPVNVLGDTPVPELNLVAQDQIGWRAYVDQIRRVASSAGVDVVVTSNYGEAGAIARYAEGLNVFSAQNALYASGPPPANATDVVFVGGQLPLAQQLFKSCEVQTELDNRVGVDNEEQGQPVAVCRGLRSSWARSWPVLEHLD
jgi:4-amino-4-deoxy-L-arabinose transferase-like glycosyltransferase